MPFVENCPLINERLLDKTYFFTFKGISTIDLRRHLRLACKRGVQAGRLRKDGLNYSLTEKNGFDKQSKADVRRCYQY